MNACPCARLLSHPTRTASARVAPAADGKSSGWWIKPFSQSFAGISAAGQWSFNAWASNTATDVDILSFQLYVIPATQPVVDALGGPLPAAIETAAVAKQRYARGYVVGAVAGASVYGASVSGASVVGADTNSTASPAPAPAASESGIQQVASNTFLATALTASMIAMATVLGVLLIAGFAVGGFVAYKRYRESREESQPHRAQWRPNPHKIHADGGHGGAKPRVGVNGKVRGLGADGGGGTGYVPPPLSPRAKAAAAAATAATAAELGASHIGRSASGSGKGGGKVGNKPVRPRPAALAARLGGASVPIRSPLEADAVEGPSTPDSAGVIGISSEGSPSGAAGLEGEDAAAGHVRFSAGPSPVSGAAAAAAAAAMAKAKAGAAAAGAAAPGGGGKKKGKTTTFQSPPAAQVTPSAQVIDMGGATADAAGGSPAAAAAAAGDIGGLGKSVKGRQPTPGTALKPAGGGLASDVEGPGSDGDGEAAIASVPEPRKGKAHAHARGSGSSSAANLDGSASPRPHRKSESGGHHHHSAHGAASGAVGGGKPPGGRTSGGGGAGAGTAAGAAKPKLIARRGVSASRGSGSGSVEGMLPGQVLE